MHKTWDMVSVNSIHPSSYHHATVTTSMHPQHMCALIYQYKEIIIEDNKYLYATITNYLTIAKNKSPLKQRHSDTKNHGEMIYCITHHVCQEIQGVDEMVLMMLMKVLIILMKVLMMLMKVLMLVLMMPLPEGVESTGGDSGSGSPLRSPPAVAC